MKNVTPFFLFALAFAMIFTSCETAEPEFQGLQNQNDSLSYSIGQNLGTDFAEAGLEVIPEAVAQGIKDGYASKGLLTKEQIGALMQVANEKAQEQQKTKMAGEGQEFLEKNKTAEGVIVHESGLQYIVLAEGSGESPTTADQVVAHYRGTLLDGTEFDSSYGRGEPATFPLSGVIQGWQIALPMMKKGGKLKIFVPYELGYGERGYGQSIPPYSTLIFEIELVDIIKAG